MADLETEFHKRWLGMAEPIEGLVVTVPVLCDAQAMARQPPEAQRRLTQAGPDGPPLTRVLMPPLKDGRPRREIIDLPEFLARALALTPDLFDRGSDDLCLYVPEGQETLRPSLALRHITPPVPDLPADASAAARAALPYVMLVLDLPGVPLDEPDRRPGHWAYPPQAKFDRLLRHCRVPIGLLTNREELRLCYAPPLESSGVLTFRVGDSASPGGRDLFDALVMLLSARRFFAVAQEHQLPQLLRDSRLRQANVTNALAEQVLDALQILLRGFQAAADRDGDALLRDALTREPQGQHLYGGLLTVLLRLVFVLYAEDRGLLPTRHLLYGQHLSLLSLFDQLQADNGAFPDTMARRFGAWPRLLALFRAIHGGARYGDLHLPARHGDFFDPNRYPFLEGWGPAGGAPCQPEDRAELCVPTVDDGAIFQVLQKLLLLDGQRLSFRTLSVEQIGGVYEALMGYQVRELPGPAVCLRPQRLWVSLSDLREVPAARRAAWLAEEVGLTKAVAQKLAQALQAAGLDQGHGNDEAALTALAPHAVRGFERAAVGQFVLHPGPERRRTSSHYTPPTLSGPIVRRTLEPLLQALGEAPSAASLLTLKVCDPAMGSGAFLVEACRFLGGELVRAWVREGQVDAGAATSKAVVTRARRLVAQRCLYGVDKNPFAVSLAKLSLWLETLAEQEPFTFVDHALRHGDSLVGLSLDALRAFHWKAEKQRELFKEEIDAAMDEALGYRQGILALADQRGEAVTREKEGLLRAAEFALERARAIGDLVVGAFFAHDKDKDREKERTRRLDLVTAWLRRDEGIPPELEGLREEVRREVPVFHWPIEFPEVFYAERSDPLTGGKTAAACFDAVIGNPPFLGGSQVSGIIGEAYRDWLLQISEWSHGNSDLCAHFFRRANTLLGVHGTIGLLATNSISRGDTRETGLKPLLHEGLIIYDAVASLHWPGVANVAVSIVHLAKGVVAKQSLSPMLDHVSVEVINSRLRCKPERGDPVRLAENLAKCFKGSMICGIGFVLTLSERDRLINSNPLNSSRIFPYIGGEEVNTSPTHAFDRYVINFESMTLDESEQWPELIAIVRDKVKPDRENNNRAIYRRLWWQYAEKRPELCAAITSLKRCLVISRHTKHLCLSFLPSHYVFSDAMSVFSFDDYAHFGSLQSRIHEVWARLLSGSLEDRLRYTASDCFETFPFPAAAPLATLEDIGARLYEFRAAYMKDHQFGLTQTYNRLKDPECQEPAILTLRRLHEDLDRAVLAAYGWADIPVPAYDIDLSDPAWEAFSDEVLDRLFALNAQRAAEEAGLLAAKGPTPKKPAAPRKPKAKPEEAPQPALSLFPAPPVKPT